MGAARASAILPTICDHMCSVAYVSFQASYGSAGQRSFVMSGSLPHLLRQATPTLPLRGPANCVEEQRLERAVLEQIGFVAELEVHVPPFVLRVRPDDRMIAHPHAARRLVALLIDVREHVHVGPRGSVVGVPLVVL